MTGHCWQIAAACCSRRFCLSGRSANLGKNSSVIPRQIPCCIHSWFMFFPVVLEVVGNLCFVFLAGLFDVLGVAGF